MWWAYSLELAVGLRLNQLMARRGAISRAAVVAGAGIFLRSACTSRKDRKQAREIPVTGGGGSRTSWEGR